MAGANSENIREQAADRAWVSLSMIQKRSFQATLILASGG
jgi:hypothetical protein